MFSVKKLIRFETNQLFTYMLATVDEAHKINILLKNEKYTHFVVSYI